MHLPHNMNPIKVITFRAQSSENAKKLQRLKYNSNMMRIWLQEGSKSSKYP